MPSTGTPLLAQWTVTAVLYSRVGGPLLHHIHRYLFARVSLERLPFSRSTCSLFLAINICTESHLRLSPLSPLPISIFCIEISHRSSNAVVGDSLVIWFFYVSVYEVAYFSLSESFLSIAIFQIRLFPTIILSEKSIFWSNFLRMFWFWGKDL